MKSTINHLIVVLTVILVWLGGNYILGATRVCLHKTSDKFSFEVFANKCADVADNVQKHGEELGKNILIVGEKAQRMVHEIISNQGEIDGSDSESKGSGDRDQLVDNVTATVPELQLQPLVDTEVSQDYLQNFQGVIDYSDVPFFNPYLLEVK